MQATMQDILQWVRAFQLEGDLLTTMNSRHHLPLGHRIDEESRWRRLELALPALFGRFGVLPDYFTDELLLLREDGEAMRDFLDIFNHRLLQCLFQIWLRTQPFLENAFSGKDELAKQEAFFINRLCGLLAEPEESDFLLSLRWHKMATYRKQVRTKEGLMSVVQTLLPHLKMELESFVVVTREIPIEQRPVLGRSSIRLGMEGNLLTGLNISDPSGGIRLIFKDLDYNNYMSLLPGGKIRALLAGVVGEYTRGAFDCLIRLQLRACEVPTWQLGQRRLSMDGWIKSTPCLEDVYVEAGHLEQ